MADETKKIYAPASVKEVKFANGNSILKFSFSAEKMMAFIQSNQNEKGYINFGISSRREVGKYGETHTVWLDTWEPKPRSDTGMDGGVRPAVNAPAQAAGSDGSEIPF